MLNQDHTALNDHASGAIATAPPAAFNDRPLMTAGILAFGIAIPWLTGLYGPIGPAQWRFWVGMAGFIGLAAALWLGNRWLLFKQREHFDWFANPWRKLLLLISANVLYTAPLTLATLLAWYRLAGLPPSTGTLQVVTLTNVICVIFVTHAYETVFLIRERESDLLRVERLDRARAQAELDGLKAQLDPHFLFNSLNTLGYLIEHDAARGREFCDTLAEVYRYVLDSRRRDLVPLRDELDCVRAYHRLLALRFGTAIGLDVHAALTDPAVLDHWLLPPLGLQTLLENAVKHNRTGQDTPLRVQLSVDVSAAGASVCMVNPMLARSSALPSSGLGLRNLDERCRLLTGTGLRIEQDHGHFDVRVPLVPA